MVMGPLHCTDVKEKCGSQLRQAGARYDLAGVERKAAGNKGGGIWNEALKLLMQTVSSALISVTYLQS